MLVHGESPSVKLELVLVVAVDEVVLVIQVRFERDPCRVAASAEDGVRMRTCGRVRTGRVEVVGGAPGVDALVFAIHDHDADTVLLDQLERVIALQMGAQGLQDIKALCDT